MPTEKLKRADKWLWLKCHHCDNFVVIEFPNQTWCLRCNAEMYEIAGDELKEIRKLRKKEKPKNPARRGYHKSALSKKEISDEALQEMLDGC